MDQNLINKNTGNPIDIDKNKIIVENQTLLLILDIQEKIIRNIPNKELILFNIKKLIETCDLLKVHIAITEQNPLKLGKTVKSIIGDKGYPIYEKMEFSCSKNKNLLEYLAKYKIKNIILCGIESHICILQSSIELLGKGFNILIARDAIGSRHIIDNDTAFLRLISSGAVASTTESLICELCKTSNRKEFREISKILKNTFSS
mgnify:CR=1 FL=1|tara:strand:- start:2689 stop:3300 length:612 start_codon:yes stop_codon:yes gene_type:complete